MALTITRNMHCIALYPAEKPTHDDVIKWKHFQRRWLFVRGIHRSPANSLHKGQWRGALMFSLICARINGWVNNREAGDLRRHRAHYDVIVMTVHTGCMMMAKNRIVAKRDTWTWYITFKFWTWYNPKQKLSFWKCSLLPICAAILFKDFPWYKLI